MLFQLSRNKVAHPPVANRYLDVPTVPGRLGTSTVNFQHYQTIHVLNYSKQDGNSWVSSRNLNPGMEPDPLRVINPRLACYSSASRSRPVAAAVHADGLSF